MSPHRPLLDLLTRLGLLLICAGAIFAGWQYRHAQRLGQAVAGSNAIADSVFLIQQTVTDALLERRYAGILQQESLDNLAQALEELRALGLMHPDHLRWLSAQKATAQHLADALDQPMGADRRAFLIDRLGQQLGELSASTATLNRTAFFRRSQAVERLFWTGIGLFALALFFLASLRLLWRRHQRLELQSREEAEQHRLEMERANAQLQSYSAELEQYLRIISHDLKEPIRSILAYGELLELQTGALEGEARSFVEQMRRGARRMQRLLDDLVRLSALEQTPPEPVAVDARQEVTELLQMLRPQLEQIGAEVQVGSLPQVVVDRSRFGLLLQNLLSNAIKYRDPGRPLRIVVSAEDLPGQWRFRVEDNGSGIPPEYRERVFGLFTRLHGREIEGTGAGLALCRKSVEQWGGTLRVAEAEGPGTAMVFTIPKPAPTAAVPRAARSSTRPARLPTRHPA